MNPDVLENLATALCPDAELAVEVRLAVEDPTRYVTRFAKRLRLRGIRPGTAVPDLPWIALVDGDPDLLDAVADTLGTAPTKDSRLVEAVDVLLQLPPEQAVAEIGNPDQLLEAVGYLQFAEGREAQVFAVVLAALTAYGLPDERVSRTGAIVRALCFPRRADRARPAFLALDPPQRDVLREIVHGQLRSRDDAVVEVAVRTARVVGDRETLALVTAVDDGTLPQSAKAARGTASFLRNWPGGLA